MLLCREAVGSEAVRISKCEYKLSILLAVVYIRKAFFFFFPKDVLLSFQ